MRAWLDGDGGRVLLLLSVVAAAGLELAMSPYDWLAHPLWLVNALLPVLIVAQLIRTAHRLELEAARRRRLQDVGLTLSTTLDVDEILRRALAIQPLGARWGIAAGLYDESRGTYVARAATGGPAEALVGREFSLPMQAAHGVVSVTVDAGVARQARVVPFSSGARPIGSFLIVEMGTVRGPTAGDLAALAILGGQVAASLDKSRMYAREVAERRRNALLADAGRHFASHLAPERVIETIAAWVVSHLGTHAYVATLGADGAVALELRAADPDDGARPDLRPDVPPAAWRSLGSRQVVGPAGEVRRVVDLPLALRERLIGLVSFALRPDVEPVGEEFLAALADRAALALENARLFAEIGEVEALRELDRIKTEFVTMVSHELRTPLTLLAGYGELLISAALPPEQVDFMHRPGHRAALDLARIVDELLDFSRIESGRLTLNRQVADIGGAVSRVVDELRPTIPHHDLILRVGAECSTLVDEQRLRQIIAQLVSNAVHYSRRGTPIEVRVEREERAAVVRVRDRGVGIPQYKLEEIFEKFVRLGNEPGSRVSGIGMGLALCRFLVEAHGGRIWAESALGEGSTFSFTVPLVDNRLAAVFGPVLTY